MAIQNPKFSQISTSSKRLILLFTLTKPVLSILRYMAFNCYVILLFTLTKPGITQCSFLSFLAKLEPSSNVMLTHCTLSAVFKKKAGFSLSHT